MSPSVLGLLAAVVVATSTVLPTRSAAAENQWPELLAPTRGAAGGGSADAAVVVAVEDYPFLPKVRGAVLNGEAWVRFFLESRHVPRDRVLVLKNGEAVREAIVETVRKAAVAVGDEGTLWVLFIGHGAPSESPTTPEVYIAGVEAQKQPELFFSRSVSRTQLVEAMSAAAAHAKKVLILDACFTGETAAGDRVVEGQFVPATLSPVQGVTIVSASAADQVAGPLPRSRGQRPGFSYLLLGALRGWADGKVGHPDGRVDLKEAVRYVSDAFLVLNSRQAPSLSGPGDLEVAAHEKGPELQLISEPPEPSSDSTPVVVAAVAAPPADPGGDDAPRPLAPPAPVRFDADAAAQIVRRQRRSVERCLVAGNVDVDALTVEVAIDGKGRVGEVALRGVARGTKAFECVAGRLRATTFQRSSGGPHRVVVRLEF